MVPKQNSASFRTAILQVVLSGMNLTSISSMTIYSREVRTATLLRKCLRLNVYADALRYYIDLTVVGRMQSGNIVWTEAGRNPCRT